MTQYVALWSVIIYGLFVWVLLCILSPWELDSACKADSHAGCQEITRLSQTCAVYLLRLQENETYFQPV